MFLGAQTFLNVGVAGVKSSARQAAWNVILPATMVSSDTQTIQAVLDGQIDRYSELVEKYQQQAIRLAFSLLGNEEDAKDASQEAFVNAYRALRQFRQGAKFSTWLYRIVVNECKDIYKRRARRPMVVARIGVAEDSDTDQTALFMDVADAADGPTDQLSNQELSQQLTQAIGTLAMKQRTAFSLHYIHGLTLEEVATVMGCRLGTVKAHIFRATAHLRARLAPWLVKEGIL